MMFKTQELQGFEEFRSGGSGSALGKS